MKKCLLLGMVFVSHLSWGQTYSSELAKSAKNGDLVAQRDLGICYLNGSGVKQNDDKAYEWLLKAASCGDGTAQFYIGRMYEFGKLYDLKAFADCPNPYVASRAFKAIGGEASSMNVNENDFYKLAAENGCVEAMLKMANYWLMKKSPEGNYYAGRAAYFFKLAAEQGNADAQYEYANLLLHSDEYYDVSREPMVVDTKKQLEKGEINEVQVNEMIKMLFNESKQQMGQTEMLMQFLMHLASEGKFLLGDSFSNPLKEEAIELLNKAAKQGHQKAAQALQNN